MFLRFLLHTQGQGIIKKGEDKQSENEKGTKSQNVGQMNCKYS